MRRVARPLVAMGARVELESGDGLPMVVEGGALRSIEWTSETASAQIKSAILLAGVVSGVAVGVTEPSRSRDHTERMLRVARRARRDRRHARARRCDRPARAAGYPRSCRSVIGGISHRARDTRARGADQRAQRVSQSDAHRVLRRAARDGRAMSRSTRDAEQGGEPTGSIRASRVGAARRLGRRSAGAVDDRRASAPRVRGRARERHHARFAARRSCA